MSILLGVVSLAENFHLKLTVPDNYNMHIPELYAYCKFMMDNCKDIAAGNFKKACKSKLNPTQLRVLFVSCRLHLFLLAFCYKISTCCRNAKGRR